MPVIPLWAKLVAVGLVLAAVFAFGHEWGAAGVQADWDKETIAAKEAKEKKALADAEVAAKHEAEVAALRAQIRKNQKGVYDAIRNDKRYAGCIADNGLVGLWEKSYLPAPGISK